MPLPFSSTEGLGRGADFNLAEAVSPIADFSLVVLEITICLEGDFGVESPLPASESSLLFKA